MFLSMSSSGGSMLRSDNCSLLQVTSIHCNNFRAQLAFADLFTTKAYSVVVSVYVHSLQSMVVAPKKYVWSTV